MFHNFVVVVFLKESVHNKMYFISHNFFYIVRPGMIKIQITLWIRLYISYLKSQGIGLYIRKNKIMIKLKVTRGDTCRYNAMLASVKWISIFSPVKNLFIIHPWR